MLTTMFAGVPDGAFDRCLELGAGDGFLSTLLARHARVLFATEIRRGGLREDPPGNVRYAFCDAEALPFRAAKFDLIFTSHLLEHLPDLQGALADMRRTLDEEGLMVHLVPSRLWKILDLALFFPSQAVHVLEVYTKPDGAARAPKGMRSTVKVAPPGWWRRS
jgi:ubiquinone/menaquinone biosynthesis C-methylase UbiE